MSVEREEQKLRSFAATLDEFTKQARSLYQKYGTERTRDYSRYTIEELRQLMLSGNTAIMRDLSRFFYRFSGVYRNIINYYANLLRYYTIVSPRFATPNLPKEKARKMFDDALMFVDKLDLPLICGKIVTKIFVEGAFYGLFQKVGTDLVLQELPAEFCRSTYRNSYGLDVLEFDLDYFTRIRDEEELEIVLAAFPAEVVKAYNAYKSADAKKKAPRWIVVSSDNGMVFYYNEIVPYFLASLPSILRYEDSQDRESARDDEELQKILVNKLPLGKDGEPVFTLEEAAVIHKSISSMLGEGNSFMDVLTTFGEVSVEKLQEARVSTSLTTANKFGIVAYDELGLSSNLFNAQGNTALKFSSEKDTALMMAVMRPIMKWVTYQLNRNKIGNKVDYEVELLPVTTHNKKEMTDLYLRGAQYGYSKFYAGVALGIKQSDLIGLLTIENDVYELSDRMVPLMSSHTTSMKDRQDGKSKEPTLETDTNSEGGRPPTDDQDQSDKTVANDA